MPDINNINISLFNYTYLLIVNFARNKYVVLTSLGDIAAMKMNTIIQRALKHDFIDSVLSASVHSRYFFQKIMETTIKIRSSNRLADYSIAAFSIYL